MPEEQTPREKSLGRRIITSIGIILIILLLMPGVILIVSTGWQIHQEPVVEADDPAVIGLRHAVRVSAIEAPMTHSYEAPPNWAGDYTKAFVLGIPPAKLEQYVSRVEGQSGTDLDEPLQAAVNFVTILSNNLEWFPDADDVMTDRYVVIPVEEIDSEYLDRADILIAEPATGKLYYVAIKM